MARQSKIACGLVFLELSHNAPRTNSVTVQNTYFVKQVNNVTFYMVYPPVRTTQNAPPAATCATSGRLLSSEALVGTANLVKKKNVLVREFNISSTLSVGTVEPHILMEPKLTALAAELKRAL